MDVYFSADVETDGPIPGPYSMLSFALVLAGTFDGAKFRRPMHYSETFYAEMKPISENYQNAALNVNGLDREYLKNMGQDPVDAMRLASNWVRKVAGEGRPVLVAFPLSFDWSWLYWYFTYFCANGSPFGHSRCFDIKTAYAVKAGLPISRASRSQLPSLLRSQRVHTHHALDDAKEQAEIFGNIFEWEGAIDRARST